MRQLTYRGWRRLRDGTLIAEASVREPRRVAVLATLALQDVWQLVHPAFLRDPSTAPKEPVAPAAPAIEETVQVDDPDQLRDLIAAFLSSVMGAEVKPAGGSIELPVIEGIRSWVRVGLSGPTVECFARLVPLSDRHLLWQIVGHLGERWRGFSLYLSGGYLCAQREIECAAFHPDNLRNGLREWQHFLADGGRGIIDRVVAESSATGFVDESAIPERLRDVITQSKTRVLSSSDVADLCSRDTNLILEYLRICDHQLVAWTERATDSMSQRARGDVRDRFLEAGTWRLTGDLLRSALRLTVIQNQRRRQGPIRPDKS
ncbi:hypothetical protein GORHZ_117_00150 [Gordonia rhizosphera NBRC 16068]|uniref:Uncharacterized protein n=1 Tax=Gordonia rhizosphera NBRC 16068 TaxID=1108045 RepID=K6WEY2_9ACTN|nr:hypothetical protein [Gordonia rhizosphera]GAB90752.1 hypothetical protein GORHZ_117_00150 [Gordonia rhizosphera NBRC 16068]